MANGHGGRRAGAGRPPGSAWGPKARSLRASAREAIAEIIGTSADPLPHVCAIAADPNEETTTRLTAASIALPYIHPRLSAVATVHADVTKAPDANAVVSTVLDRLARLKPREIVEASPESAAEPAGADAISADYGAETGHVPPVSAASTEPCPQGVRVGRMGRSQ